MICPTCKEEFDAKVLGGEDGWCPHCKHMVFLEEPAPRELGFIDSKQLMTTPKERGYIVQHILQKNTVNQIFSPPACFKSIIALQLAICVANGREFIGFKTKKTNVAYLDKENNRQILRDRTLGLFKGMGLRRKKFPLFFLLREGMLDNDSFLEQLSDYVMKNKIGLIVFDTLVRFNSGEENSAKDMNKLYQAFVKLQEGNKTAILFLHHTNRMGEFRGSSDLLGQVDTQFSIERNQKSSVFKMINTKNRLGEIEDINGEVIFAEDSISVVKNDAPAEEQFKERVNKFQLARAFVCDYAKLNCPTAVNSFERGQLMLSLEIYNSNKDKEHKISRRLIDGVIKHLVTAKVLVITEKRGIFSLNMDAIDMIDKWISPIGEGGHARVDDSATTQKP